MNTGTGKSNEFGGFLGRIAAPVIVNGKSVKLYSLPKKHFNLVERILKLHPPEECGVGFSEFNGAAVFVGILQGKTVPCVALDVHGSEVDIIAAQLQKRLQDYSDTIKK